MFQYAPFVAVAVIVAVIVAVAVAILRIVRSASDDNRQQSNRDPIGDIIRFAILVGVFFVLIMV